MKTSAFSRKGEWGLVDRVGRQAGRSIQDAMDTVVGPGDDAAVMPLEDGDLVVTTDLVAEGTHFFPDADPRDVGRFAAGVNLSDLAAMGARPVGFVAATGAPATVPDAWFEGVVTGLLAALEGHCPLVGGDMKTAPSRVVTGTAFGSVPQGRALLRSGAKAGDVLVATGTFGAPGAALHALSQGTIARDEAMRVVYDITPRIALGLALREAGAHAAVDTSDGLARSATLLAEGSGLQARIDLESVPVDRVVKRLVDPEPGDDAWVDCVLATGGEYELVAAVPQDRLKGLMEKARSLGVPLKQIGGMQAGQGAVGRLPDRSLDLHGLGWRQR